MLGILPSTGRGETVEVMGIEWSFLTWNGLTHLAMPAVNLALTNIALVIRLSRAGTREVMLQDYIKFARAKGLSQKRITLVHVLKNITLIPVVTVLGLELGSLIAFSVVTETVFRLAGHGQADHRVDPGIGPAHRRCLSDADGSAVRHHQPDRRYSVFPAGPAGPHFGREIA